MKCKYPSCPNEARAVPHPRFPDHINPDYCSHECHEMFLHLRDLKSIRKQEHESPQNTMLRIEYKLDELLAILKRE
jgi:hypothetical protein